MWSKMRLSDDTQNRHASNTPELERTNLADIARATFRPYALIVCLEDAEPCDEAKQCKQG